MIMMMMCNDDDDALYDDDNEVSDGQRRIPSRSQFPALGLDRSSGAG